jgi:hypothetical protein
MSRQTNIKLSVSFLEYVISQCKNPNDIEYFTQVLFDIKGLQDTTKG